MKKVIITATLGLMVPLMSMGQSTLGPGVIGTSLTVAGSPHNFSGQAWNPVVNAGLGGQICQPCHTPHNAQLTSESALWNRASSTAAYTMYTGFHFGVKVGTTYTGYGLTVPDGISVLCLSCHDGSIGLGQFGGQTATNYMTGGALLTTDLSNDHPISFVYDSVVAGGVWALTHTYSGTKTVSSLLDANGKVQCSSCHGVHSNSNGYQLKMSNTGSALCLACHKK